VRRRDAGVGELAQYGGRHDRRGGPCCCRPGPAPRPHARAAGKRRAAVRRRGAPPLDEEPVIVPDEANEEQRWLVEFRADVQAQRDEADHLGQDTTDLDAVVVALDEEINEAGMRGNVLGRNVPKRSRSTKRRQDAPDLPKRKMTNPVLRQGQ
jgi:hypothetical protein